MQHGEDVQVVAAGRTADAPQISGGDVEQVGDAHVLQRLLQLQLRLGVELGNGDLHIGAAVVGDELVQVLAGEILQIVRQRHALVRQKRYECILPAVVGLHEAGDVVAGQVDALRACQVVRRLLRSVGGGKGQAGAEIGFGVGCVPAGIEAGGIDQIQHGQHIRRLLQQPVDHAVGLLGHPAVQIGDKAAVKGGAVHFGAVVVDAAAQEIVLHPEILPHPRGVGQRNGAALTGGGQAHAVGVQKVVQLVQAHAGRRFQLLQRVAAGAVGHHAQRVQHGHRRDQHALRRRPLAAQQGQGEGRHRLAAGGQVSGGVQRLRLDILCQLLRPDAAARHGQDHQQRHQQRHRTFFHRRASLQIRSYI